MKKNFLSVAIVLIALFTFSTAFIGPSNKKSSAHFVSDPCLSTRDIKATVAGLGSGGVTVTCSGKFVCINKGGNIPTPQSFTLTQDFEKRTGGNFKLSFDLAELCPNRNFTFQVQDLNIVISTDAEGVVLDQTFAGVLQDCK